MEAVDKLELVFGYLHEKGFDKTLETLQLESGEEFDPDLYTKGGKLESILDESVKTKGSIRQRQDEDISDLYTIGGEDEYAKELYGTIDHVHTGNVISLTLTKDGILATGGANKIIHVAKVVDWSKGAIRLDNEKEVGSHTGGILDLSFHPTKSHLLATASMDKSGAIINVISGEVIQSFTHTKYVNRVIFSPNGDYFIMTSYDRTASIYKSQEQGDQYELVKQIPYRGIVEAVDISHDGQQAVIGVREDNCLHFLDLTSSDLTESIMNMNELGDDWVSFTPMDIKYSPNDQYVCVCTDKDRIIIYSRKSGKQVRNLYGLSLGLLGQPRVAWHPTGRYLYATAHANQIFVYDVATQCRLAALKGHTGIVRNLLYNSQLEVLVSCSYDKTVRFWK